RRPVPHSPASSGSPPNTLPGFRTTCPRSRSRLPSPMSQPGSRPGSPTPSTRSQPAGRCSPSTGPRRSPSGFAPGRSGVASSGRQTPKECQAFTTPDAGRKVTELYNMQHLQSNTIDKPSRVVITTIQRLYSVLHGDAEMPPELDEVSAFELEPVAPVEVAYKP